MDMDVDVNSSHTCPRNGSSIPPRLPALSAVLKLLHQPSPAPLYTLLALSYRGYWTSTGRPSEAGLVLDAGAALAYAAHRFPACSTRFVLWGQSLGASVALSALSTSPTTPPLHGLVLETPFLSTPAMLHALYPSRWLPYRYLTPFLLSTWDAPAAVRALDKGSAPPILILAAARDELVPPHHARVLERLCRERGLDVQRVEIGGALHTDVMTKKNGRSAVAGFLSRVGA